MADYYTYFSCLLDVKTAENARQAQTFYEILKPQDGSADWGFALSLVGSAPSQLWFDGDVDGAPEHVREFVLHCASAFRLEERWGFEWSFGCSKARPDAFGGGAMVLDLAAGTVIDWISTYEWLSKTLFPDINTAP